MTRSEALQKFFPGRTDAYALQQADGRYLAKRAPLTLEILDRHCQGLETVGVYPLLPDGNVSFAALDIDCKEARAREALAVIHRWLGHFGIPSLIEPSGSKGYHLWLPFKNPVEASLARRLLHLALLQAEESLGHLEFSVEVFPKQAKASDLGNLIKLPFGKHRKAGKWTRFVSPDFEPLDDWGLPALEELQTVTQEEIEAVLEEFPEPEPPRERPSERTYQQSAEFNRLALEKIFYCAFVAHCRDQATQLTEPFWWSMIHILLAFGEPGMALAHELSAPYPGYTFEETQGKIAGALEAMRAGIGPHTCSYIQSQLRFSCPETCKASQLSVISPSGLAKRLKSIELVLSRTDSVTARTQGGKQQFKVNCPQLGREIMEKRVFHTFQDTGEMLVYRDGVYRRKGEVVVKQETQERLLDLVSIRHVAEVVSYIGIETYADRADFDSGGQVLNLRNGLLNLATGDFTKHSPDFLSTIRLPIDYDPQAKCPRVKQFFEEVFLEQDWQLIEELVGYCLEYGYPIHRSFLFVGDGNNGKSTWIELVRHFLGPGNCSTLPLQALETNRFASSQLFGKLANLYADLPSTIMRHVGTFKMLTGGDRVPAERKFRDPFDFPNVAKLIFSANKPPKIQDEDSLAFWRRWVIVNCPNQFSGEAVDKGILHKLTTSSELSGLLNLALAGLRRLRRQQDFSYSQTPDEVAETYLKASDPIYSFVTGACDLDPNGWISKDDFYGRYKTYCRDHNIPLMGKETFGRAIKASIFGNQIISARRRIDGEVCYGWGGVSSGEKSPEMEEDTDETLGDTF